MNPLKKIFVVSGIVIILIQFIRPVHNHSSRPLTTDISKTVQIPDTVGTLLKNACYDCHSDFTDYPWYSNIQPMGWLMAYHIKKAKNQLNLSEFGTYSQRRQLSKLDGIINSIRDNAMPLPSYKIMHKKAKLSAKEKEMVIKWAQQAKDSISLIN